MKYYTFDKLRRQVILRKPSLNDYDKLVCEYLIRGDHENPSNDGFFFNAEYSPDKGLIFVHKANIAGKRADAFILPQQVN